MKTWIEILESKQVGILYHHTSFSNLIRILKSNSLVIGRTGKISFTRSKNFLRSATVGLGGVGAELILDGDKLSNNYKITPYKYHGLDVEVDDEFEERVLKNIKDLNKYLKGINLYKTYFSFSRDRKEKYLINRLMGNDMDDELTFENYKNYLINTFGINIKEK